MRSSLSSYTSIDDLSRPKVKRLATRVTVYHSLCEDISRASTVHSIDHLPCIPDPSLGLGHHECHAVHFGLCAPLETPPSVDIGQLLCIISALKGEESASVAKKDSYRDKIQAAIELLAAEEEPQDLERFLRNFVEEDRRKQKNRQILIGHNELETDQRSGKLYKSKNDKQLNANVQQSKPSPSTSGSAARDESPSRRVIVVRQKTLPQIQDIQEDNKYDNAPRTASSTYFNSRLSRFEQSDVPKSRQSTPTVDNDGEKLVFGLSSKSSLSRHKQLIENRNSPSPPPQEHATVTKSTDEANTPRTSQSPSLSSPSFLQSNKNGSSLSLASANSGTEKEFTTDSSLTSNNIMPKVPQPPSLRPRPLSAPIEQLLSQLTDDEKALALRQKIQSSSNGTAFFKDKFVSKDDTSVSHNNKSALTQSILQNDKPKRVIVIPKPMPAPKPEAQTRPSPKCVKGKMVFGQHSVKPIPKGSVAERVLLFERCPPERLNTKIGGNINQLSAEEQNSAVNKISEIDFSSKTNRKSRSVQSNSLSSSQNRGHLPLSRIATFGDIPRFYYPRGRPYSSQEIATQIARIKSAFDRFPGRMVTRKEFPTIVRLSALPLYWKEPLFRAIQASDASLKNDTNNKVKNAIIKCETFCQYWKSVIGQCYDEASRFMSILTNGQRNYLLAEDFAPLIQDVIETHPGLAFLRDAIEFHSRYVATVIARIYYNVNRSWSGKITLPELRASNLLLILHHLEEEDDINQITEYFSYEHFYVIYCKFWELDKDHDLFINKFDLCRHNDGAISTRMIDRLLSGAVSRCRGGRMSYTEFVWFLLAEEDKRHPRSIEYWFRAMDIDGDGCLSYFEMEYFYREQIKRMEALGIEPLPFSDCLCQMLDLIRPRVSGKISLADLKKCSLISIFFDTFFNLEKYLEHEQRDPFASTRDDDMHMSDWDKFAAEEYEILVSEESSHCGNAILDFTDGRISSSCSVIDFTTPVKQFGLRTLIDDDYDCVNSNNTIDFDY